MKSVTVEYSLSPLAAIPVAFETTYYYSVTSLKMMGKMLIGKASVENLSGPISIAQYAGQSATMGLVPFLKYMALDQRQFRHIEFIADTGAGWRTFAVFCDGRH